MATGAVRFTGSSRFGAAAPGLVTFSVYRHGRRSLAAGYHTGRRLDVDSV